MYRLQSVQSVQLIVQLASAVESSVQTGTVNWYQLLTLYQSIVALDYRVFRAELSRSRIPQIPIIHSLLYRDPSNTSNKTTFVRV